MTSDQVAAVATELADMVELLSGTGHHDEAVEIADGADLLLSSILALSALPVVEQTAWILHTKAIALCRLDRLDLALAVHETVTDRYDGARSTALAEVVARSLFEKGSLLEQVSRPADSTATYDELTRRFGHHREPPVREVVATGLTNKALQAGDPTTAVRRWDEVLEYLYDAAEPQFRSLIAMAMRAKAEALSSLGRPNEEITIYDRLISRFGADTALAVQAEVAKAVHNRDAALSQRSTSGSFLSRAWARLAGRRTRAEGRPVAAAKAQDLLACYVDLGIPPTLVTDVRVQALITAAAITMLTDGSIGLQHEPLPEADLWRLFGVQRYSTGEFARHLLRLCEERPPRPALDQLQREWGEGLAYMLMMPQARDWTANAAPRTRVRHDSVAFGDEWGQRLDGPINHVIEIEPGVPAIFAMQDLIAAANQRGNDRRAAGQRADGIERTGRRW